MKRQLNYNSSLKGCITVSTPKNITFLGAKQNSWFFFFPKAKNNKQLVGWHFQATPRRDFCFRPGDEKLMSLQRRNKQKANARHQKEYLKESIEKQKCLLFIFP